MQANGSGRGGREYGDYRWSLAGVLTTDPRAPAPDGWNERKWDDSPFGRRPRTGATHIKCGMCGLMVYPVPKGHARCRCDFDSPKE